MFFTNWCGSKNKVQPEEKIPAHRHIGSKVEWRKINGKLFLSTRNYFEDERSKFESEKSKYVHSGAKKKKDVKHSAFCEVARGVKYSHEDSESVSYNSTAITPIP